MILLFTHNNPIYVTHPVKTLVKLYLAVIEIVILTHISEKEILIIACTRHKGETRQLNQVPG